MKITKIHAPTDGAFYSGVAVSTRGRRYIWKAARGGTIKIAIIEDHGLLAGQPFGHFTTAPRSLASAVRKAVTQIATVRRRAA